MSSTSSLHDGHELDLTYLVNAIMVASEIASRILVEGLTLVPQSAATKPRRTETVAPSPVRARHEKAVVYNNIHSRKISRRTLLKGAAVGAAAVGGASMLAACGGSSSSGKGEVVVLSWQAYITDEIIEAFQESTGIRMRGIPAESDQDMFSKIQAGGGAQYDVVFANCGWSPTYHANELIEVIDLAEVPSSKDLYPVFVEDTALPYVVEPRKVLMYPNMWAPLGLGWNTTAPFRPAEPLSWNALWDAPRNRASLQGGHDDFIAIAGLANGVPREEIYAMDGDTLRAASDKLASLKPFLINSQNSDDVTAQRLASGEAYVALTSTQAAAHRANVRFAGGKDIVDVGVPKEGTLGWVDGPQLTKGAKNRANALTFIEWFGGNADNQKYLWGQNFNAQCSKVSVERLIAAGGEDAVLARSLGADRPELAKQIVFQAQPDKPDAWASAYDQAMA
ncbi:ABC transporter substrate-binding protein [Mycolicibacterium setense]